MLFLTARGLLAACLLLLFQSPSIRFDSGKNLYVLENWTGAEKLAPERYSDVFTVSVDAPDVPPLLGQYRVENGALLFAPQFPVQPGVRYRAVARIPGMADISAVIDIPKRVLEPTTVVGHVYPSTNVLPENQLKFYIHFSAPMARGFAYQHVWLLDQSGNKVDAPFLELNEELWDPEGRRFTLFFDPGRIKRGLLSQEQLGVALHEGRRYTLLIEKGWRDANGVPLASDFRKSFTVGTADRKPIDVKNWRIQAPPAGTRNPVTVTFPESLDHALMQRELDIVDASGTSVLGSISVGENETRWTFTPDSPWKKDTYELRAGTVLADLAGNMIGRLFDIDVFEQVDQVLDRSIRSISFKIN